MSTPVQTEKWAGNFDCSECRRKRLMADEFSKKAIERYRKQGGPLRCKDCVAKAETKERSTSSAVTSDELRKCVSCQKDLKAAEFNKNQWNKGEGKSRCRSCVEKAIEEEKSQQKQSKDDAIAKAREDVALAKETGDPKAILKAESVLSSLEAEKVTGLKPVRMGRGRGRGRVGSGGRGMLGRGRGGRK